MNEQSIAQATPSANSRQEVRHVLFLSHAGVDAEAALRLADRIEATPEARENGLKVWVDKRDLEAGSGWQQQLERAIEERSTAFAVYLGATGIINWVDSEVRLALSRARHPQKRYPFIPIISASAEGSGALPGFARQYQGVFDVESRPEELGKLIRAALGASADRPVKLVDQPFPGLRAFDEEQAHLFFGREAETEELVEKLRREPLVMVVGDSGSGKSSLVRAGLVPRFRGGALADLSRDHPDDTTWHVVIARPRGRPFEALADAIFNSGEAAGIDVAKLGTCKDWIRTGRPEKVRDGLIHAAPPRAQILLVIDQFEELLTQAEEAGRQPYIDALLGLVADPGDRTVRTAMTMRYDYYNLCSQFPVFFDRLEGQDGRSKYPLERMKEPGLRACVREPLKLAGVPDTETLANEVVKDIGERAGNLALLQTALKEAWQKRKQFKDDLLEAYVSVGRVTGALANAADEVFENRLNDQERQRAEVAFIRLVRLGDTGGTTRRTATRDEFSDDAWEVMQKLATEECRRLLFIGGESGKETVELAHEALATQWPRYQTWLQQAADDKRWLDRLIDRVVRWRAIGEKNEDLATGTEREEFECLAQARPSWLAPSEHRFVKASAHTYQEEQDRKEKARLRELSLISWLKRAAIATTVVALVAIAAGAYAWFQRDVALEARDLAKEQEAAAQAARNEAQVGDSLYRAEQARKMLVEGFPVTAMQLALAGLPEDPASPSDRPWLGETAGALVEAMGAQRELKVLKSHEGGVWSVAFSPEGDRIVSAGHDGAVRLWQLDGSPAAAAFKGHDGRVYSVAFSPNGDQIVSGGEDGTVRLWQLDGSPAAEPFKGHAGMVTSVAFSPEGDRIVSGGFDGTVRLWQLDGSPVPEPFKGHEGRVDSVALSPEGDRIVSGGEDGTVRLWRVDGTPAAAPFEGDEGGVYSVAFSPEGDRIVSGGFDGTVRLWQLDGGPAASLLQGHYAGVPSVAFSHQGDRIVSGGNDGTVRVWDAASGAELLVLRAHQGWVPAVAFSPEGDRIVSGGGDGTVRLWQLDASPAAAPFEGHKGWVSTVALSPEGDRIVSGGGDGTVRLWQLDGSPAAAPFKGHEGWVSTVAFSRQGDRIVSGGEDGTVRLWQLDGSPAAEPLKGHAGLVTSVAFSPKGDQIVSGGEDGTVRLWQLDGRPAQTPYKAPFQGHVGKVWSVAFSPEGDRIVSGGDDGTVRLWQLDGSPAAEPFKGHEGGLFGSGVRSVAFSPEGDRIVSAGEDGTVRLWQLDGSPAAEPFKGHGPGIGGLVWVPSVAFSQQGDRIVSGGFDGTVRVWDAASEVELLVLRGHEKSVESVAFSPDGARIVSGSEDTTVRVTWIGRNKEELIATARARLPRELTDEERRRFHLAVE